MKKLRLFGEVMRDLLMVFGFAQLLAARCGAERVDVTEAINVTARNTPDACVRCGPERLGVE
jgi:hypothetical protein